MGGISSFLLGGIQFAAGLLLLATGAGAGLGLRLVLSGILTVAVGLTTPSGRSGFESSPTYGFDLQTNPAHDGGPEWVIYGKAMVAPQIISQQLVRAGTTNWLNMLFLICEGEIESITDIRVNDAPLSVYEGSKVDFRLGTSDQTPISGFNEIGTAYALPGGGTRLDYDTAHVYEMKDDGDGVNLAFTWSAGLFAQQLDGDLVAAGWTGKIEWLDLDKYNSVLAAGGKPEFKKALPHEFSYANGVISESGEVQPVGWTHLGDGRWEVSKTITQGTYKSNLKLRFLGRDRYVVRVTGSDPAETKSTRVRNVPTLSSVIEIHNDQRAYANKAILALRLPAQEQLTGGTPRVTCLVKGRKVYDFRDGTTAWSRNPVLCLHDLLTNARYGVGSKFDTSDMDTGSGGTWRAAADACDEELEGIGLGNPHRRHELDLVLDVKAEASGWVSQIAEAARLRMYWADGLMRLVHKEARSSVREFSEDEGDGRRKNIVADGDGETGYLSTLRDSILPREQQFNVVRVKYVDRMLDYRQQTITVRDQVVGIGAITGGPITAGEQVRNATGAWRATVTRAASDGDAYLYVSVYDTHAGPLSAGTITTSGGATMTASGPPTNMSPERPLEIQAYGITRHAEAVRHARFMLHRHTLNQRFISLTAFKGDKDLLPEDTIRVYASRLGWAPQQCTVTRVRWAMDGTGQIEAQEYDQDVFSDQLDVKGDPPTYSDPGDAIPPNTRPAGGSDTSAAEDEDGEQQKTSTTTGGTSGGSSSGSASNAAGASEGQNEVIGGAAGEVTGYVAKIWFNGQWYYWP